MKIKNLKLENYGRFESSYIKFSPIVTVFVGNNGAGKSQVLQALATSLSWFIAKLIHDKDGLEVNQKFIKNGSNKSSIQVIVDFGENNPRPYGPLEDADWSIGVVRKGRLADAGNHTKTLRKTVRNFQSKLTNNHHYSLPIIAFYPVDRGVVTTPIDIKEKAIDDQLIAYEKSLENTVNFDSFFSWFREREDIENESIYTINFKTDKLQESHIINTQRIEKLISELEKLEGIDSSLQSKFKDEFLKLKFDVENASENVRTLKRKKIYDKQLEVVRSSINTFTGFNNIRIRRQGTPTMIVEKDGEELDVNQLSQGEKSLLALIGDIARRLAILNPSLDNPLKGEGVVMIDEVDLHLHPKWQHDLIDKLVKTFPNVQFILTTHSPHVISDRNDILVYSLDDGELEEVPNVYGQDVNTVLTKVFDVDIRDSEVEIQLNDIRRAISHKDYLTAEEGIEILEKKMPADDLELLKCRLMLAQAKVEDKNKTERDHAND